MSKVQFFLLVWIWIINIKIGKVLKFLAVLRCQIGGVFIPFVDEKDGFLSKEGVKNYPDLGSPKFGS